jgi:hypothetical protein
MQHMVIIVGYFSVVTGARLLKSVVCGYQFSCLCGILYELQCSNCVEVIELCFVFISVTGYVEYYMHFSVVTVVTLLNSTVCGYQC